MKKTNKLLLFLCCIPLFVGAQQTDTLIYRYRNMAVEYQQAVKIAQKKYEGAESTVSASKAGFMPRLDMDGAYKFNGNPIQLPATGQELENMYQVGLWVTQPVLTGGYLKNTKAMAEAQSTLAQSGIGLSKQNVMLEADGRYLLAVTKKEASLLAIQYKDAISSFLKVIQDRVDEEVVGMNELYQAKVRFNDAQYETLKMDKEFRVSLMELNRLIGLPLENNTAHADSLSIINWRTAAVKDYEKALKLRPEIDMIESEIEVYKTSEKIEASAYNPKLSVGAGGTYGAPSPGMFTDPGTNYHVVAQLNIPIYQWGQKRDKVFARQTVTEQSKLDLENTVDLVKLEVTRSFYELERNQEQVDFAYASLENASKNVDVMLDRYQEGLSSVLEVLDAQLFWQKSYKNYIEAKFELNITYSLYQKAMGEMNIIN